MAADWSTPLLSGALLSLTLLAGCLPSAAPTATTVPVPRETVANTPAKPAANITPPSPRVDQQPLATASRADAPSMDALYEQAKQEGGTLSCYCSINVKSAEKIFAAFAERFPSIKVDHVDATSDALTARAMTEARGGKVLGDVFSAEVKVVARLNEQGLLAQTPPPEAVDYPAGLKGAYWVASDVIFITASWNTDQVKEAEEPKQFEDFADPRWKGSLIAEPRDVELLVGLARHKYGDDGRAIALVKQIAANGVEFHKGHSELTSLLAAGQAAACITCYAHQYPPLKAQGAPVDFMRAEAIGFLRANAIFREAPHPETAMLFWRWATSEEGQRAYAAGGLAPAHPKVEPIEPVSRPDKLYPIGADDIAELPRYEQLWKESFELR